MKRFLVALLALIMILGVFVGCEINPNPEPTQSDEITSLPTEEPTKHSTNAPTEEPTTASTVEPTVAPTEEPTVAPTEEPTIAPTEEPTVAPTEEPTVAPTEEPTVAPTEEPTEEDTGVYFESDFMISGEYASDLKSAFKSNKIKIGKTKSDTVIYVGEADAEIVTTAKAQLTRANNYYDFTIITDGKNLAIYALSEIAIQNAIDYLIANYTEGGYVAVPNNLSYTYLEEQLADIKIGGNTFENITVVAPSDLQDIASGIAGDFTLLTGYSVPYGTSAEGAQISLVASGSGNDIGDSYTVTYSDGTLSLTAQNKVTLAYAASGLIKAIKEGLELTEGFSETYTLETQTAYATDIELFKYCGTWQATDENNPTTMVSYWDAAYVEVDFTGNAITLMFSSPTTFMYRIDKGEYHTVSNVTGDYTVFAEGGGVHTVRVLWNEKGQNMYFAGVKAGGDVTLTRTPDRKYYVQFIGDSISDATNSFSHNSADLIDWDYSVTACEALSLVRDMGYWRYNNGFTNENGYSEGSMADRFNKNFGVTSVGMEDAFFKLGIPNKWKQDDPRFEDVAANYYTEKYDFNFQTGNTPDIVFIFLGTNDISAGSSEAAIQRFKDSYVSFVEKLLELYGKDTQFVIMQSLSTSNAINMYDTSHPRFVAIREIASTLTERYPDNVYFLDENTHFSWGVEISSDGTHPSANGYETLTKKVAQWLEKNFK